MKNPKLFNLEPNRRRLWDRDQENKSSCTNSTFPTWSESSLPSSLQTGEMSEKQAEAGQVALISVLLLLPTSSIRISSQCDGRGCELHSHPAQVVHRAAAAEERHHSGLQGEENSHSDCKKLDQSSTSQPLWPKWSGLLFLSSTRSCSSQTSNFIDD